MTSTGQLAKPAVSARAEIVARLESLISLVRDTEPELEPADPCLPPAQSHSGVAERRTAITAAAKDLYRARRRRERHFAHLSCAFGEPIWDLMLDLFVAQRERRPISISSACLAANVPATTGLRWLQHMEINSIVVRVPDPVDRRRAYVRLADPVELAMERYIDETLFGQTGQAVQGPPRA